MNVLEEIMTWMKKYQYYIITIVVLIVMMIGTIFLYIQKKEAQPVIQKEEEVFIAKQKEKKKTMVTFDIKGQVKTPGVYQLESGKTVNDAIIKSGGLLPQADTTYLNLSRKVTDEMVIIVYSKQEIMDMKAGKENVVVVEGKCQCPNITNDACIKEEEVVTNQEPKKQEPSITGPINLNTATLEQLETLPGIGPSKAEDIIAYREEHQGFKTIEELKNVKGIGDATFDKLKDKITVS